MQMDSALSIAFIALAVPGVLVVLAIVSARHRGGAVASWLQRHSRGLVLFAGIGYVLLGALRFLGVTSSSTIGAVASLCAGLAFLVSVVLMASHQSTTSSRDDLPTSIR